MSLGAATRSAIPVLSSSRILHPTGRRGRAAKMAPPGAPRPAPPPTATVSHGLGVIRPKAVPDYGFLTTQRLMDDWPIDPGLFGIETQPLMPPSEDDSGAGVPRRRKIRPEPPGGAFGMGCVACLSALSLSPLTVSPLPFLTPPFSLQHCSCMILLGATI